LSEEPGTGEVPYEPSAWGQRFHNLSFDFVLGGGSAGLGKSIILLMDPYPQIFEEHQRTHNPEHPFPLPPGGSTGWALHLRRTRPELTETIGRSLKIFPRLDPEARYYASEQTWHFSSGYMFQFGHCQNESDWTSYLSKQYTHLAWDELITFTEEQFDQISTRVRSSDPVLMRMLRNRAMSNPMMLRKGRTYNVPDPTWVRRRFVEPAREGNVVHVREVTLSSGKVKRDTWMFMPGLLRDNPSPEFIESYEVKLRLAPAHIRQALLYGNWFFTVGSYYGHVWRQNIHVCEPFKIPDHWPMFRMMDWGFKKPGCVHWCALDEDDNMFIFYEYTFRDRTDKDVARAVQSIETNVLKVPFRDGKSQLIGVADTQLWEQRGNDIASMAEVFHSKGVPWLPASKNRVRNAQLIYKRLGDHRSGTATPGLVIFRSCKKLVEIMPAVQSEQADPEMPTKDDKTSHWHESLGYGAAFASRGRRGIPERVTDEDYRRQRESEFDRTVGNRTGYYGSQA